MVGDGPRPRELPADPPRFRRCRRALLALVDPTSGTVEESPYRRCPVGVIAATDCPEYVGACCGFHEDRGDEPVRVVPPEEAAVLARELSHDYLTVAYARRIEALRAGRLGPERGAEILAAFPVPPSPVAPAPIRRERLVASGPVNVAADVARAPAPRSPR